MKLLQNGDDIMNKTLIYTVHEVAKILHSSLNYVYKLIEYGLLPAIKLGSIEVVMPRKLLIVV